jgi:hypothetical protein
MKETETSESTPEELLKMLDAQLAVQRSQRGNSARNRAIILVGGVLFIVIGAGAALLVLDQMLADMPHPDRPPVPVATTPAGKF